jgi:hypothetical protein
VTDISARRLFILAVAALLLGIVIGVIMVTTASAAPCDPAYTAQCCACEPSGAAEPAPLPHLYLPAIAHGVAMSSEYTPAQPIVTPEPDVELPLGDAGASQ